ncbi:SMC-Scp complex subunit ScpB [Desertibaculum subflavum]|uniref:SMC-Scp complex subunit ScpB n=1 Tax=Desertibaculum subflavum TaxID=2268458 RepID=UPI000E670EEC
MSVDPAHIRIAEALLFAAAEPLDENTLAQRLPEDASVPDVLAALAAQYDGRGVGLQKLAGRWAFVTAPDLAPLLSRYKEVPRKLSRAAVETLAIIAYHQPVTRAEIEEVRGVALSKGTLDLLLETGWIRMRGRRRVPGRPVTYGTSDDFLVHFGLDSLQDLPGIDELKAAGLLDPGLRRDAMAGPLPGESPAEADSEDSLDEPEETEEEIRSEPAA